MKILENISAELGQLRKEETALNLMVPDFFKLEHECDDFENYLLWIVDTMLMSNSGLTYHHIMVPEVSETKRESLLKAVYLYFVLREIKSLDIDQLQSFRADLTRRIDNGIRDQNGLKGSSVRFKKLLKEQKQRKRLKKFVSSLIDYNCNETTESSVSTTLFNVLTKDKKQISEDLPSYDFVYQELESFNCFSGGLCPIVIFNSNEDLRGVDVVSGDVELLDNIRNVVLFGVEGRSNSRSFNFQAIRDLNEHEETRFENLVIISFLKNYSLNKALNKLQRVNSDFYFRTTGLDFNAYAIHPVEKRNMLNLDFLPVDLIPSVTELYGVFVSQISEYEDLNEMLSIRARNIYSLCFSAELKDYILMLIFSSTTKLLHEDTVEALASLPEAECNQLRTTLEMLLDSFLISEYNSKVFSICESSSNEILIPVDAWNDEHFIQLLSQALGADNSYVSWRTIFEAGIHSALILDYRDSGGFPFRISPNIHEFPIADYPDSSAIYRQELFGRNYHYTLVEYWNTTLKYLFNNPVRYQNFQIDRLIKELEELRPEKLETYDLYDIDNNYSRDYETRCFRIEIDGARPKKYLQSDQFLVGQSGHYSVLRVDDLCEDFEELVNPKVQLLEDMYLGLNLFETTQAEKEEIVALKQRYNLNQDDIENRLWKVVLRRKVDSEGADGVYNLLTKACEEKGGKMVSKSHFENNWLDSSSSSLIPRSKKTFLALVELLDLPIAYYKVMLKQRAKTKLETRKSSSKMNSLIIDLVENGMFDTENQGHETIDSIAERHPLDEIGIQEDNYRDEIIALVDLIKDNIRPESLINIVEE